MRGEFLLRGDCANCPDGGVADAARRRRRGVLRKSAAWRRRAGNRYSAQILISRDAASLRMSSAAVIVTPGSSLTGMPEQ